MKTRQIIRLMFKLLISIWCTLMFMSFLIWRVIWAAVIKEAGYTGFLHRVELLTEKLATLPLIIPIAVGGGIMAYFSSKLTMWVLDKKLRHIFYADDTET